MSDFLLKKIRKKNSKNIEEIINLKNLIRKKSEFIEKNSINC